MFKRFFASNIKLSILTTLLFVCIWLMLVEFDYISFIVGGFFILIAVAINNWLLTLYNKSIKVNSSIRLLVLPKFIFFFVTQSFIGGLDTAKRAFLPTLDIKPGFIKYEMRFLTMGVNSNLFTNLVSLLPGSLIVMQEHDGIIVHVLSLNIASQNDLVKCESIVAELYGIDVNAASKLTKAIA